MAILHAIVHQLTLNDLSPNLHLSSDMLPDSAELQYLFQETRSQYYGRSSKRYGQLSEATSPFKALTEGYIRKDIGFLELSQKVMSSLQTTFTEQDMESDGYWLLVHERASGNERLWWFHLKHKAGLYVDQGLALNEGKLLDMSRLGFAMCLALPEADAPQGLHQPGLQNLTISFGFGDKAQQNLLTEFVDFVEVIDTLADTENFIAVVSAFTETLPEDDAAAYRRDAVTYCLQQDQAGEAVSYQTLSDELDNGSDAKLGDFIQREQPELEKAFIPNRARLKKYVRFSGKNNAVSISFTNETLGKNVQFHPEDETLVIRDLPAALLKQLKQQL